MASLFLGGERWILTTVINRLIDPDLVSELEKVMFWLAIDREGVSLAESQADVPSLTPSKLLEALRLLGRRSLIEKASPTLIESNGLLSLQPVVMKYVTSLPLVQMVKHCTVVGLV